MKKLFYISLMSLMPLFALAQSPYISKVYDYRPAPGQFVNKLPEYEEGDSHLDLIRKAEESVVGEANVLVSLGGYGGYIIFGFDHMVENKPGYYDFKIWGNAFYANANPNPDADPEGGSCEPGIVMVSYDANENGIPDDEWYELAGSEYFKPKPVKNYRLTYFRPDPDKDPTPDNDYMFLNDTTYIKWESNQGTHGYVSRNVFHSQSYYPEWIDEDIMVFEGTKLADNYVDESGNGSYYVLYSYRWGYVDNHPNNDDRSGFDISWAVDNNGNHVSLPGIHFVKVYTGVNQYCGWLGETSTEITGAEDLHIQGISVSVPAYTEGIKMEKASILMNQGDSEQLSARVYSSNPSIEVVSWSSSNESVAIVNNLGVVQAVAEGTAAITALTSNGKFSDECIVTVNTVATGIDDMMMADMKHVSYSQGVLYVKNMSEYKCTVFSIQGNQVSFFVSDSDDYSLPFALPRGIYILRAQKNEESQVFKFIKN